MTNSQKLKKEKSILNKTVAMNSQERKALVKSQKALAKALKCLKSLYNITTTNNPETTSILSDGFKTVGGIDNVANVVDTLEWKVWSVLQREETLS